MNLSIPDLLAFIALCCLAGHALFLLLWTRRFTGMLSWANRRYSPKLPDNAKEPTFPRAVVLLAVRGADPSLPHCLHGLLHQDHPNYDICVILDSREDPAWELVANLSTSAERMRVHVLTDPKPTCSLKLSALLQVISGLDDGYEVLALIDADVIPYAGWLRDLARPLGESDVGASTGLRWYSPPFGSGAVGWGTLVRYVWNAAASLHMVALQIPWGGSLAFRLDVLRRSDLLDKWSRSLFEDVGCFDSLRKLGLKVQVVPEATMVNRETIDLKGCFHFIRRQLLDVRLYHSRWGTVLTLGLVSAMALALSAGLALFALANDHGWRAGWLGAGLACYFVGMMSLLLYIESGLTAWYPADSPSDKSIRHPLRIWFWMPTLLALPLTQLVYVVCLVSASFLRRIVWRGIAYEFDGPFSVRLIQYRPYTPVRNSEESASVT